MLLASCDLSAEALSVGPIASIERSNRRGRSLRVRQSRRAPKCRSRSAYAA